METQNTGTYVRPECQVIDIEAEKGFCGSMGIEDYLENDYGYNWGSQH